MYIHVHEMHLCSLDLSLNVRVHFSSIEPLYLYFFTAKFTHKPLIV